MDVKWLYFTADDYSARIGGWLHVHQTLTHLKALGADIRFASGTREHIKELACEQWPAPKCGGGKIGRAFIKLWQGLRAALFALHSRSALYTRGCHPWLTRWYRLLGRPVIVEFNGSLLRELKLVGLSTCRVRCRERATLKRASRLVFVSKTVLDSYEQDYFPLGPRAVVVHNGVEVERFALVTPERRAEAKRALGLEGKTVVGFCGNLHPYIDLAPAVETLKLLPESWHLVVVGDGVGRARLDAAIQKSGVAARVHVMGKRSRDEVPTLMCAFDVAVGMRRIDTPAFPLKLTEYLACGLPSVMEEDPGLGGVDFGRVLSHPTAEKLHDDLLALLPDSPEKAWARSEWARENLSWRRSAEGVLRVMRSAASECYGPPA